MKEKKMTKKRPETLPNLLKNLASEHGDETALIYDGETLAFGELEERSCYLAGGLACLGIGEGDRVAVWLPNLFAPVELEFALARLGAVAVALNTRFRAHEVEDILSRSGARALAYAPNFKGIGFSSILEEVDVASTPELETEILVGGGDPRSLERNAVAYKNLLDGELFEEDLSSPEAPCNVFTSSGTTSVPKLVLHSQKGIENHARAVADAFGYGEYSCVALGALPFCGVFGFNSTMSVLAAGRPCVLMPVFDSEEAVQLIETHNVTHLNGTDEMLHRILRAVGLDTERVSSLKEAGFASFNMGGEELVENGDSLGKRFYQCYGSTEVQALMAHQPSEAEAEQRALAGGVPSSVEYEVRVRDRKSGELLSPGEPGELEVRGPNVMLGYMGDPEAEEENFTDDGYVRTGDLGYLTEYGFVYLSRIDDALRLGGFLVSPQEIEAYLEGLPGVAASQVVGVSTENGTVAVGFVVVEEGREFDEGQVIEQCRKDLAKFKVPRRIIALTDFPKTEGANGVKVKRDELREMAAEALETEEARSGARGS
jgi:fatty-acyl-CoA synthase